MRLALYQAGQTAAYADAHQGALTCAYLLTKAYASPDTPAVLLVLDAARRSCEHVLDLIYGMRNTLRQTASVLAETKKAPGQS